MFNFLFIETRLEKDGTWLARWRWDNAWAAGKTKAQAILYLKENSYC